MATFAEVEKVLSETMRGSDDDAEIQKIEDVLQEIQSPIDATTARVKVADIKLKQKKVRIAAAETLARIHGAFDPKGTGAEDTADVVKKIIAGLKKSGVKPRDFMELLQKEKPQIIDVESEVSRDETSQPSQ